MLTKEDHGFLLQLLQVAQFNGIQAAAHGVAVYHKLTQAIQEPNDSTNANQSCSDESA